VQKTAEELKRQQEREAEERTKAIASRVPQLNIDGLDQSQFGHICIYIYIYILVASATLKTLLHSE